MKKCMLWSLGVLIFLIIGFSVFTFIKDQEEIRQLKKEAADSDRIGQELEKPKQTLKKLELQGLDKSQSEYHVHPNGTMHIGNRDKSEKSITQREKILTISDLKKYWDGSIGPNGEPIAINSKQSAQLRRIRRYLSLGIEPPPKGYDYILIDNEEIVLDNGQPFLINVESSPTQYWVTTRIGFAPTLQQFKHYQELQRQYRIAKLGNNVDRIKQLSKEIELLAAEAQGKLPRLGGLGKTSVSEYGTEAFERSHRQKKDYIRRIVYRHMGLEHMIQPEPKKIVIDGKELIIIED